MDIDLKSLQKVELKTLLEVVKICGKHNLTYYLIGGTLLGAVRHSGFIPWDDDIDIAMPRKDFEYFLKIIEKELPDNLYMHYGENDKNYYLPFAKIRNKNTEFNETRIKNNKHKGIFIDIFILDNSSKNEGFLYHVRGRGTSILKTLLYTKVNGTRNNYFFEKLFFKLISGISSNIIFKSLDCVMKGARKEKDTYYINYGCQYGYKKQTLKKVNYFPPKSLYFEGYLLNVPAKPEVLLESIYGSNYMQIPKIKDRVQHEINGIKFDEG